MQIKTYSVIYDVIDDIKAAMLGLLEPKFVEKAVGRAEVPATFSISKVGTIAGCLVVDGKAARSARARLVRDGVVVHDGKFSCFGASRTTSARCPRGRSAASDWRITTTSR